MAYYRCGGGGKGEKHFATLVLLTEDEGLIGAEIQLWLNDDIVGTKTFTSSGVINFKAEMVGEYVIKCPTIESFTDVSQVITADDLINNNVFEVELALAPALPPKVLGHIFQEGNYRFMVVGYDEDSVRVVALHIETGRYTAGMMEYLTGNTPYKTALSEKWNVTNKSFYTTNKSPNDYYTTDGSGKKFEYENAVLSIWDLYDISTSNPYQNPTIVKSLIANEIGVNTDNIVCGTSDATNSVGTLRYFNMQRNSGWDTAYWCPAFVLRKVV